MSSDPASPNPPSPPPDDTLRTERLLLYADQSPFATPKPGVQDNVPDMNIAGAHAAVAREKGAHAVSNMPLPLWALIPISSVLIIGGSYLGSNMATGPNIKGYDYTLNRPDAGEVKAEDPAKQYLPEVWIAKGRGEYSGACVSCHQASGEGQTGLYPHLKGSEFVIRSEKRLAAILLHGLSGPVTVDGKGFNGVMPAGGGAPKSDKQLAQILSYVRKSWGNDASLIYDDQIEQYRKELRGRTTPFSEAELRAIPEDANLPPTRRNAEPAVPAAAAAAGPAANGDAPVPPGPVNSTAPSGISPGK